MLGPNGEGRTFTILPGMPRVKGQRRRKPGFPWRLKPRTANLLRFG